ncbi:8-oxo-dGTP pyrophosphatase MutT (NUDIX family) [Aeromonas sp. BIGb0405]|jgi:8-oxo-dGTP pyrophosphatase MutT (NUDIX family)|uniref:CoA pyrophosphatase n=1 Tax=unclassified Aeromonas TaxID=257493 RepID=UPI0021680AA1|nr:MULTISPECIES: CoA pyrophosphatase [unclassified Aeromonas]MCS3454024.1 8-oxo-dGTP pyrophosphatase MutT (NUDIX family) [Aeromonas sp. BIGb0405]MCS3459904.1 8-oxo-dGTP pyrophosphatase MutT (NUDIX family) [Aeromonas sp. BIGb0445]
MTHAELLTRFLLQRLPLAPLRAPAPALSPAAVLMPLVERADGLHLLLTERSRHLRHHAGEISFPGGRQDPGDDTLYQTALRETREEIGIAADQIQLLGHLPRLPTVSRFEVLPVVGLLDADYRLQLNADEVTAAFEVPLAHLQDLGNYVSMPVQRRGQHYELHWIPWQHRYIWGATASMIRQLIAQIAR